MSVPPSTPNSGNPAPQAGDVAAQYDSELAQAPEAASSEPVDRNELKAGAQERAKQRPLLHLIAQENELRYGLVIIELGEERREDLSRGKRAVGTREIGARAPVLA